MLEKVYEDATHDRKPERASAMPYLKLMVHAKHQVREREAALAELQAGLAQADHALHEKEALLLQTGRTLEMLQEDHANLNAYLLKLRQTPLFKLQDLLTKLSRRS